MNVKRLVAAVAVLAAVSSSFAQPEEFVRPDTRFAATRIRAEANTEATQARLDGTLRPMLRSDSRTQSGREVRAELAKKYRGTSSDPHDSIYVGV